MATDQEIIDAADAALLDLLGNPASVQTDAGSYTEIDIEKALRVKKALAADSAASATGGGLRFAQIAHKGTQG